MTFGSFYFKRLMQNTYNEPVRLEQYVYVKAFLVNVHKCMKCMKPFFLEQHINIVNRVTFQRFWFIYSCLAYTQRKYSSNNHLHTISTKLITVRLLPLTDQKLEEPT